MQEKFDIESSKYFQMECREQNKFVSIIFKYIQKLKSGKWYISQYHLD